jgi:hypothetical protein
MSAETRVRTVTAGVHPHRATDGAGHTDGPFEAGETRGRTAAGRDGQARGPADAQLGARDPDELERTAEHDGDPAETAVGHEQIRAVADDEHVDTRQRDDARDLIEVIGFLARHEQIGRAADAVGRQRPDVAIGFERQRVRRHRERATRAGHRVGIRHRATAECRAASNGCNSSGSNVRSPAPSVRQRSPGRNSSRR